MAHDTLPEPPLPGRRFRGGGIGGLCAHVPARGVRSGVSIFSALGYLGAPQHPQGESHCSSALPRLVVPETILPDSTLAKQERMWGPTHPMGYCDASDHLQPEVKATLSEGRPRAVSHGSYMRTLVQSCRPDSRQAAGLIKCSREHRAEKTKPKTRVSALCP